MPTGPRKWSVHPDSHGDLKVRGLVSCLLDDGPKVGLLGGADPPPPRYKGGVLPLNYGSEKMTGARGGCVVRGGGVEPPP